MNQTPSLPITADSGILTTYVKINETDVQYYNFKTSRLLTITGSSVYDRAQSLTADQSGSNSSYHYAIGMAMFNRGFSSSYSSFSASFGLYSLEKDLFDTSIKNGSFTATVSGSLSGDYYDSGSGQLISKESGITQGAVLVDDGMIIVTGTSSALVDSITSVKYRANVFQNTINVFCKCQPDQFNFSLNPTAFESDSVGDWMKDPFTASTTASKYRSDFTVSGISWQPMITSVGLYDDNNNMLAIAKLATPLRKSTDIPMTFLFRLDL